MDAQTSCNNHTQAAFRANSGYEVRRQKQARLELWSLAACRIPRALAVQACTRAAEATMDQRVFIAQLNIEHYHRKLAGEKDEKTRQTVVRLLAEEEAKLATLNDAPVERARKG
jgi:hypothetical protein